MFVLIYFCVSAVKVECCAVVPRPSLTCFGIVVRFVCVENRECRVVEKFEVLAQRLRCEYPLSQPHLAVLSGGTAVLNLQIASHTYIFGYYPDSSRIAVFGPDGDTSFKTFEEAESWLRRVLEKEAE